MIPVPFVKYTSYGNNFVIVDETRKRILTEFQKSAFAYQATNVSFGVGCDNLLLIQNCSPEVLERIQADRLYFPQTPEVADAEFIFRMFEPDGQEAYSCGNGLMCIAAYLQGHHGVSSARILTEIPTGAPRQVTIGTDAEKGTSWANMGMPGSIPTEMVHPNAYLRNHSGLDRLRPIEIRFRAHDLKPFSDESVMTLWGYLVFTGEPHLVIFPGSGFTLPGLADMPFISPATGNRFDSVTEKRYNYGTWLVKQIGCYINTHYRQVFPRGINVNFARVLQEGPGVLEYRCFERGINRETLACGTGALAVAYAARKLSLVQGPNVSLWPCRCRWYQHDAEIRVAESDTGWWLVGKPRELFGGLFAFDIPGIQHSIAGQPTGTAARTGGVSSPRTAAGSRV